MANPKEIEIEWQNVENKVYVRICESDEPKVATATTAWEMLNKRFFVMAQAQ